MDFVNDVIIDEDAFNSAVREFSNLSFKLHTLRIAIENMLDDLKDGFDTPAGKKFISAYKDILIAPLEDQKRVIEHVSENLKYAKESYSSIFEEYSKLNDTIKNVTY